MKIKVAGIDPSLRNWGMSKGIYDTDTGELTITDMTLCHTESENRKTVRVSSDDMRCAAVITEKLHEWIDDCTVVFGEVPSGSQSARGTMSNGICLGIMSGIGIVGKFGGKMIQVSPTEVKVRSVGVKTAAKHEIIEWAMSKWPNLPWFITKSGKCKGEPTAKNEHLADSIAAINAGILTDEFKSLVQLMKSLDKNTVKQSFSLNSK